MIQRITFGLCLVLALATTTAAQPGKTKAPLGTWEREVGNAKVTFKFMEKQLTVTLAKGGEKIEIEADYGVTSDGIVFGRIGKVKSASGDGPDVGMLFSFKTKQEKSTLTISDLTGTDNADARDLVQGDYTLQAKKE